MVRYGVERIREWEEDEGEECDFTMEELIVVNDTHGRKFIWECSTNIGGVIDLIDESRY